MAFNQEEFINQLSNLTVVELVTLTKALEDKWGVKAAPVAVAAAAGRRRRLRPRPGRGEDGVHRRPQGRRRQQDRRHQGRSRSHGSRPEGREGPRRRRSQGSQGRREQDRGGRTSRRSSRKLAPKSRSSKASRCSRAATLRHRRHSAVRLTSRPVANPLASGARPFAGPASPEWGMAVRLGSSLRGSA